MIEARLSEILPWYGDPPDSYHRTVASELAVLWLRKAHFGSAVAHLSWLSDGIQNDETALIDHVYRLATSDPEHFLPHDFPIYDTDDTVDTRKLYLDMLSFLAFSMERDHQQVDLLVDLPQPMKGLMADARLAVALVNLASRDVEATLIMSEHLANLTGDLAYFSALRIAFIAIDDSPASIQGFRRLVEQPWFLDGLTDEEAALLAALPHPRGSPERFERWLATHYIQSRTISLPLSGDIGIWVFKNTPFSPTRDWAGGIERTIRAMEELLGKPFPTTDVILRVDGADSAGGGGHAASFMYLREDWYPELFHETAHYVFAAGPGWWLEGGAEFAAWYVARTHGGLDLDSRRARVAPAASNCRTKEGIANLMHMSRYAFFFAYGCRYSLGEEFLLDLFALLGEEEMGPALGEVAVWSMRSEFSVVFPHNEVAIYEILRSHTPVELRSEFDDIYLRLHGAPSYLVSRGMDDHANSREGATELALNTAVSGALDHDADSDYFRFPAQKDQRYRINVQHETLLPTNVWVYDRRGNYPLRSDPERGNWSVGRTNAGPELYWTAPSTGEYYVSVENFGGGSGPYTLTVVAADDDGGG